MTRIQQLQQQISALQQNIEERKFGILPECENSRNSWYQQEMHLDSLQRALQLCVAANKRARGHFEASGKQP